MRITRKLSLNSNLFIKISLIALFFLAPLVFYPWGTTFSITKNTVAELIILIIGGIWLIKLIENGDYHLLKSSLTFPILVFTAAISISLLQTNSMSDSLKELARWGSYVLVYFIIISTVSKRKWVISILITVLLAGFIASLYGIFQFYGIDFFFWREVPGRTRLFSTFGNPNYLAGYLAPSIPLTLVLFCLVRAKWQKVLCEAVIIVLYTGLLMTLCRGAWVSLFISVIFILIALLAYQRIAFFKINKNWLIILAVPLVIVTIIYSTSNPLNLKDTTVIQRVSSSVEQSSFKQRFLIWLSTIEMIREKPFLGISIGTFGVHYPEYQGRVLSKEKNKGYIPAANKSINAHNDYLHLWAEVGIVGLICLIWIIIAFFKICFLSLKKPRLFPRFVPHNDKDLAGLKTCATYFARNDRLGKGDDFLLIGLMGSVLAILIHSFFSFPFHIIQNGLLFWLMLALSTVIVRKKGILTKEKEGNCIEER